MNKSPNETREFFKHFKQVSMRATGDLIFFPPAICLEAVSAALQGSSIKWGAQNCFSQAFGAFTGENSANVVKELGGTYLLIGHSERRLVFNESDVLISDKVSFAQSLGLVPMLCVGETLEEREFKKTFQVLEMQLEIGLSKADRNKPLVIAYEPVWAIGTGKVAAPVQVAETHTDIFNILKRLGFEGCPIIYGGSVKAENAPLLIKQPHVSGFLVGGASLEPQSFIEISSV